MENTRQRSKLAEAMASASLTRKELTYLTGLSRAHVDYLVNGDRTPGVMVALRIARALGTSVEALWGQDGSQS